MTYRHFILVGMLVMFVLGVLSVIGLAVLETVDNPLSRNQSRRNFQDAIHCRTNDGVTSNNCR